ncbi:MAG: hypothetical protein HYR91_03495 [Flavobacteriia bacterium]|nr:hypothetical protein [Flavobacteriia bacterium]
MLNRYSQVAQIKELKMEPKNDTINAILNYSKSVKVEKVNRKKVLLNLN